MEGLHDHRRGSWSLKRAFRQQDENLQKRLLITEGFHGQGGDHGHGRGIHAEGAHGRARGAWSW